MAEFQRVVREYQRMNRTGDLKSNYDEWVLQHPERAEKIIMEWAAEHPLVTNGEKFKEVFGFTLHHKFCVSGDAVEWLDAEYKGGQDG